MVNDECYRMNRSCRYQYYLNQSHRYRKHRLRNRQYQHLSQHRYQFQPHLSCAPAAVPSVLPGVVPELVGSVVVGELLISDVASCNVHTVFMNVSSAMNSYSGLPDTAPVINTFDVLFGQYGPGNGSRIGTNLKCNMMVAAVCRHSVRIKIFGCQH